MSIYEYSDTADVFAEGRALMTEGGGEQPGIMHLVKTASGYNVVGFDRVRDGSYYDDLKKLCRGHLGLYQKMLNTSDGRSEQ